jgi:protein associated with RNAse G/E
MLTTVNDVIHILHRSWCSKYILKIDMSLLDGSRSETMVINTIKVKRSVKENDVLSPDSTGSKNTKR